jgi:hypothetical protein
MRLPLSKLILGSITIISLGLLIGGSVTFNPIVIGAGLAALFLSCGGLIGLRQSSEVYF